MAGLRCSIRVARSQDRRIRQPQIRDVAARAGVGVGTVSRVLNDSPRVAEPTRERVLKAIEELGFRPSPAGRRLSLGRTQTLGVLAPFFTQSSVVERVRGIDDVVAGSGYDLTIFNIETAEQRRRAFERFALRDRIDGVLVISLPLSEGEVARLQREELRVVLVDAEHPHLPHVVTDDVAGGRLAAQHLLAAGHRRIAFVGFPEDNPLGMLSGTRRLRGLRAVLRSAGVPLPPEYVKRGGTGRRAARRLTEELLALDTPPTAIFAESDVQAFGVIAAVEDAGLAIPRDVSVIGFDDIELAAAIGLTTVRQPLRAAGRRGAELLLRELHGGEADDSLEPLPELEVVERRTVGPPPA
jgi:DNA-binding LacI/PurR family transcriptional regulator